MFVRPAAQQLTIWPLRDVIETPVVGELDVNGWELGKALRLLLKGAAVVIEWLQSPIVYRADPAFRDALLAFVMRWADRERIASHDLHLGKRQRDRGIGAGEAGPLKRMFYALRPAAALRWLRLHPGVAFLARNASGVPMPTQASAARHPRCTSPR